MLELPRMDDHQSWTDAERDPRAVGEAVDALSGFRAMIGEQWRGWANGAPLACRFFVCLQGSLPEGARLWRMVQALDGTPGLADVVSDGLARKAWSEYSAAAMALEFCSRVRAAEGEAEFLPRHGDKTPDVRAKLFDRWVTIEFKALHDHEEMEQWNTFEDALLMALTARGVVGFTFDRDLTPAALLDLDAVADGLASIANRGVRTYEDLPRGTGRACLAAINVGLRRYPVRQKDDLARIIEKLRFKWWKQRLVRRERPAREPSVHARHKWRS